MENPAVSARQRVSGGCASLTSLLVSDELSILIKSAGFRRFFMALALLVLFLPSPPAEAGATVCPVGERLFNGSCYDCQDDYDPDILFDPPANGACILKTTAPFAGTYHNCDIFAGEWDGFDGFCYKPCTGGYVRSGNSCVLTSRTGQAMTVCGTQSRTCTTTTTYHCLVPPFTHAWCEFIGVALVASTSTSCGPYSYTGCGSGNIFTPGREGPFSDKFYSCPGGTTTEAGTYNDPNKCTKTSTDTYSSRDKKIGCAAGTFQGGLSSSCFKCDPGFTRESALLPEIPGACYKTSSASIVTPKKAKESCVRPFLFSDQGNCDNGLLCTAGPGALECRNVPARVGEVCGAADDCDGNNYCLNQRCVAGQVAGGSCTGVGQGTCKANLVCDFGTGTCRDDPPTVGQPCGAGQCAGDLVCSAVIGGVCQKRGESTDSCIGLGRGTCADGLVCDFFGGECRSEVPQRGEFCDSTVIPCANTDLEGNSVDLACHSGNILEAFRCATPRKIGEICGGLGKGSCEDGLLCTLTYDSGELADIDLGSFDASNIALRCTPELQIVERIEEALCRSWYDPVMAESVNSQPVLGLARLTRSIGASGSAGIGASVSVESGVVYGPSNADNPSGEYGCYVTTCGGVEPSAGVDASACFGYASSFPVDGEIAAQVFVKVDLVGLGSLNPIPVGGGMTVSTAFDDTGLAGVGSCVFGGVGKGLSIAPGVQACTTRILKVDMSAPPLIPPNTGSAINNACTETVNIRPKTGQLQLTWTPVDGAQSYQILRNAEDIDAVYETVVSGHVSSYATYLDQGLTNGTTYWYHVVPQDSQGTALCTTMAASGTPVARTRTR